MSGLLSRVDRALVRMFEAGPTDGSRRRERLARFGACIAISVTGVGLVIPNVAPYLVPGQPAVGLGLAALGAAVCLGLVAAGALLYRSGFSTPNAVRIAVWNFLGLVVLGAVLLAHGAYRGALGTVTTADALAAGNVLAISAAAHVIIGVHDARRVRAEQLAHEREKLAVLSRVLRHNLRNDATVLIGQSERLASELDGSLADTAETLHGRSRAVGDLATKTKVMVEALDRRSTPNARLNVHDVVTDAVDGVREDADGVDVSLDVPRNLWIWADDSVETALAELVENAVEHGGSDIRIEASDDDGRVDVRVVDDGPGIPADERAILSGDAEITQLKHGSGLGLWVARSVAEAADGRLTFDTDGERTVVRLAHDRAEPPVEASGDTTFTPTAA
ncbi:sensor histidine kinase [Haloplanus rubicundus]|uniref:histidine kinase n=1 Tax=Haloplanus rubicundus TaxID=1547898 RepID=A0A345DYX7_9EURY|nr:HAMP domain-containing sensor histidine kinase [Haloplanus rubicundus]AXG05149.1 sensor histidine kinase [Haloplanus rubicundus]